MKHSGSYAITTSK